jgi:hypothetical protein
MSACRRAVRSLPGERPEERCYGTGSWTGHVTPEWVLQSNLRLLYGNHQEISDLRNLLRYRAPEERPPFDLLKMKERQKP